MLDPAGKSRDNKSGANQDKEKNVGTCYETEGHKLFVKCEMKYEKGRAQRLRLRIWPTAAEGQASSRPLLTIHQGGCLCRFSSVSVGPSGPQGRDRHILKVT